jgi:hypothetical protein
MSTDYSKQLEEARKLASAAQARQQQADAKYVQEQCNKQAQRMADAILERSHGGHTSASIDIADDGKHHAVRVSSQYWRGIQHCVMKQLSPLAKCSIRREPALLSGWQDGPILDCHLKEKKWYEFNR